ncbi:MAG: hypothetical protein GTN40_05075 [Candidatus Aenigmarchaeota archaeon]|nr:hypothetical protein [Candidatus Aenigmarchaeota archaeon]
MLVVFYPEKITPKERDRIIDLVEEKIFRKNSSDRGKDFVVMIGGISSPSLIRMKFCPRAVRLTNYEEAIKKAMRQSGLNHFSICVYG